MNGTCPRLEKMSPSNFWKLRKFTLRIVYPLSRIEWIIFEMYFTSDHMEMATWGKTYWTFQESSELRGDVVREREKRRAEKDIHGKKGVRQRGRERKQNYSVWKSHHVGQWSTSKIMESWLLRVKRNTFSSLSNTRVLWWVWRFACFSICLVLMSRIVKTCKTGVTLSNFHCYFEDQMWKCLASSSAL